MRIPTEAIIPRAKLLDYLLLQKHKNDKSGFLAQAGFTRSNPEALEAALRGCPKTVISSQRREIFSV